MVTRALFVCFTEPASQPNRRVGLRPVPELECESAGTEPKANVPLETDLIQWADVIFVMERSHRNRIMKKFKTFLNGKRIVVLNIPDKYELMDPELIRFG